VGGGRPAPADGLVAVSSLVRAAGGVPWRDTGSGVEVMLVHRPRYGDWSLPKGKLERGEHPLVAAVREVREETGLTCTPQVRLPTIRYLTGEPGVEKQVEFWSMDVREDAGREPDDEIAEARWVRLTEAGALLSYAHDRGVVAAFAALPRVTAIVALVRHATAGSRSAWPGRDRLRPLDATGRREVEELTEVLAMTAPDRILSATPVRCRETVAPLAERLGLPVKTDPVFDERSAIGAAAAVAAVRALAAEGRSTVICSQGKVIPPLLRQLRPAGTTTVEDFATPKGTGWLLAFAGTDPVGADRIVA
jgi:8-oxo-dGTP pyrophosphatase MutT (NUDIX family)/phosphohistidine phosphatase SixA